MAHGASGPEDRAVREATRAAEATMGARLGRECLYVPSCRFGLCLALRHWCAPGGRTLMSPVNDDVILFVVLAAGLRPVQAPLSSRAPRCGRGTPSGCGSTPSRSGRGGRSCGTGRTSTPIRVPSTSGSRSSRTNRTSPASRPSLRSLASVVLRNFGACARRVFSYAAYPSPTSMTYEASARAASGAKRPWPSSRLSNSQAESPQARSSSFASGSARGAARRPGRRRPPGRWPGRGRAGPVRRAGSRPSPRTPRR